MKVKLVSREDAKKGEVITYCEDCPCHSEVDDGDLYCKIDQHQLYMEYAKFYYYSVLPCPLIKIILKNGDEFEPKMVAKGGRK